MSTKKLTKLVTLILAVLMCASALTACASPAAKYREAIKLTEQGDYEAAYALFTELGDYKDAAKEAARFRYLPTKETAEFITAEGTKIENLVISFNENNLPTQCIKTGENGYQHTCLLSYTDDGKLAKVTCSDTDGDTELYELLYHENGKVAKEIISYSDGSTYITEYVYNENGQMIKMISSDSYGYCYEYEYGYDANGQEIKSVYTSEGEKHISETVYNADGNRIKVIWKTEDGTEIGFDEYTYDEKGRETKVVFIEGGVQTGFYETLYNDQGQIIRENVDFGSGVTTTYDYTLDENGNAVKTHILKKDYGEETYTTEYTLVYIPFDYTEDDWSYIVYGLGGW